MIRSMFFRNVQLRQTHPSEKCNLQGNIYTLVLLYLIYRQTYLALKARKSFELHRVVHTVSFFFIARSPHIYENPFLHCTHLHNKHTVLDSRTIGVSGVCVCVCVRFPLDISASIV